MPPVADAGIDAGKMARQAQQLQLNSDAAALINSRTQAMAAQDEANKAAFHAGESAAIEQMIDFYGGAGTFAAWPQRVRDYAVETTAVNILDWASAYGFRLTPALLATIETPTLVLWGGCSHAAIQRANELLGKCIPNASVGTIDGAAHFMIATHANQVAVVLADHVARTERMSKSSVPFPL